jgi:MFS family permease
MMQMCFVGLAAAIADISAFFPSYSVQVIQTGVNSINLMGIFGALLAGWLSYGHSKKKLALLGLSLVFIGGAGGYLFHDTLLLFYIWSLVIGAGMGIFTPPVTSLMVDYFEGVERNRLSGLQTSFINAGGVLLTFAGGLLAAIAWHVSYLAFLVAIPVFVVCAVNMPAKNKFVAEKAAKQKMPHCVFFYMATVFVLLLVYNVFPSNIALFLSENNLGNASLAGGANAVFMVGGVAFGILFSKLSLRIGEFLFALSHLMIAICFFLLYSNQSIIITFVAAFVGGTSISMTLPQSLFSVSSKIPPTIVAGVFSLVASVSPSIASFVSPTVISFLSKFVSDGQDSISRFLTAGLISLCCGIVLFAITAKTKKST